MNISRRQLFPVIRAGYSCKSHIPIYMPWDDGEEKISMPSRGFSQTGIFCWCPGGTFHYFYSHSRICLPLSPF